MSSSPLLSMSHIIAADAPLMSPVSPGVESNWDYQFPGSYSYAEAEAYYDPIPTSPSPLRRPSIADTEPECLPTAQLFDTAAGSGWLTPPESASSRSSPSVESHSFKRELSPGSSVDEDEMSASIGDLNKHSHSSGNAPALKKSRSTAVAVKDYVAPDVSGLSKREARLVKNRAAAFLSRQRKREEFEEMQVRVAELEAENAKLKRDHVNESQVTQLEQENAQLQQEIRTLQAQLAEATSKTHQPNSSAITLQPPTRSSTMKLDAQHIKTEEDDSELRPPPRKSLALVVLLCALPALLALPHAPSHHTARTAFSYHGRQSSLPSLTFPLPATPSYIDMDPMHMDIDSFLPSTQPTMLKHESMPLAVSVSVDGGLDLALSIDGDSSSAAHGDDLSGPMKIHIQPGSVASSDLSSPPASMMDSDPFLAASSTLPQQEDLEFSSTSLRQRRVRITPVVSPTGQSEWSVEVDP